MRNPNLLMILSGFLALTACSSEIKVSGDAQGSVEFICNAQNVIDSQAYSTKTGDPTRELPATVLPEAENFKLSISDAGGQTFDYESLSAFGSPLFEQGAYTATFSYGDPEAEGPEAAYFYCTYDYSIQARVTTVENVTVPLANSVVSVIVSDWFTKYYPSYTIVLETESGYSVEYTQTELPAETESSAHFVKAGTKLYFSATATKTTGTEVSFPRTEVAVTKAMTWQTLRVNASGASEGSIDIVLNDNPVSIDEISVELNPDA